MPSWTISYCVHCGAAIDQSTTGRPRRFCGDACRKLAWRATKVNRKGYTGSKAPEGQNIHAGNATPSPDLPVKPSGKLGPS